MHDGGELSVQGLSVEELREQHRLADLRLRELDRHISLSPDEQVELALLKKRKLRIKDEIRTRAPGA